MDHSLETSWQYMSGMSVLLTKGIDPFTRKREAQSQKFYSKDCFFHCLFRLTQKLKLRLTKYDTRVVFRLYGACWRAWATVSPFELFDLITPKGIQ